MTISENVAQAIQNLRNLREDHKLIGKYLLKDTFFPPDILAVAVLNRSMCLVSGFASLVEAQNLVAAAPFVRLQLDNGLRFFAATLVDSADEFTMQVLNGTPIGKIKDKSGKNLTDQYLVDTLAAQQPWITSVYAETCGYVHFSEKHIFNSLRLKGDWGAFEGKISDVDAFVPEAIYLEAIGAFTEATKLTLKLVRAWATQKDREEAAKTKPSSGESSI
jgi:hypothetical protein